MESNQNFYHFKTEYITNNFVNSIFPSTNTIDLFSNVDKSIDNTFNTTNQYFQSNLALNNLTENNKNLLNTEILQNNAADDFKLGKIETQYNQNSISLPSFDTNQYINNDYSTSDNPILTKDSLLIVNSSEINSNIINQFISDSTPNNQFVSQNFNINQFPILSNNQFNINDFKTNQFFSDSTSNLQNYSQDYI